MYQPPAVRPPPPTATSDASVVRATGAVGAGCARSAALARADFAPVKSLDPFGGPIDLVIGLLQPQGLVQWPQEVGCARQEVVIKINHAQKLLQGFNWDRTGHGRHDPSALGTMWRGEAHGLFERHTIPNRSMVVNSSFARANFTASRRRAHAKTGGPVVGMKCSTPCLVAAVEKAGVVSEEKPDSNRW